MCVTLMISSLITTLYVQRQWMATKISKIVRSLIPAKTTTLVCRQRELLEGRAALKLSSAEDVTDNGVTVMEVIENLGDLLEYNGVPYRTGPSMTDIIVPCKSKLD